jgi:23S rRNA pseudouridine2605 synthase
MDTPPAGERLQKVLAHAGIASRRAAEDLILAGRVTVDGVVMTELGTRVDPARARIAVDGRPLGAPAPAAETHVTYLLNKPAGAVSTAEDPQGRPTVVNLVPPEPRVYPVGRLDADTEGLLLLSNDGDLTYRLTHPRYAVDKEYEALVRGYVTQETLRRLREGVLLANDPRPTAPAQVEQVARVGENTLLRFVIHEGRNRQIRRMMQAVGGGVLQLRRVRMGPITLGDLPVGQWRALTAAELAALDQAAGEPAPVTEPPAPPPAPAVPPRPAATRPERPRPERPERSSRTPRSARPAPAGRNPGGPRPQPPAGHPPARSTHARPAPPNRPSQPRPPRPPRRDSRD